MNLRTLEAEMWVPLPITTVFDFFSDLSNLDRLTPPWVHFQTLTPRPIVMHVGKLLEHRLKIHGVPITWISEITVWQPPAHLPNYP